MRRVINRGVCTQKGDYKLKVLAAQQNNLSGPIFQKVESLQEAEIVIIEDESLMSALMQRYMKTLNPRSFDKRKNPKDPIRLLTLESGWELLNADLNHIHVAVVDVLLPQVTGVDLVRDFRKRYPRMGLVPVTGMATDPMQRSIQELLPEGFNILSKPLRREDFLAQVLKAWSYSHNFSGAKPHQFASSNPPYGEDAGESAWTAGVSSSQPVSVVRRRKLPLKKSA